jgi:hypothetical protein
MNDLTLETLRAELTPLRNELTALRGELTALLTPLRSDLTFVRNHTVLLVTTIGVLRRDTRLLKAAMNDFATENVTSGEITALHDDLDRTMTKQRELEARIATLEQTARTP